ncbi:MAG TPA: hypothetical protein VEK39_00285 [Solirubrobacterales bacterium]|nr:hypothetical protein [Solirubrobacterales bacterium]
MRSPDLEPAAFYCVADAGYFVGAVGLVNSLRLIGHDEPIYLLDCGLEPAQRELLAAEATLLEGPGDAPPWLLKTIAPLRHPARVMVLIDADMVVTRSLAPLIEHAASGRVVAFRNDTDRFVPEWGELLDLGEVRRAPYVSSGLVLCGGPFGRQVLELLDDRQRRVDVERGFYGSRDPDYPFTYPEQDVLNAILATRPDPAPIDRLDGRLAAVPPYTRLWVRDEATLRTAYRDGTEPYVLHQFVRKPWLEPMHHSVYSRLLARLLLGEDVAVRIAERDVPRRMRRGARARLERFAVDVRDLSRWYVTEVFPRWVGTRVGALRRRVSGGR